MVTEHPRAPLQPGLAAAGAVVLAVGAGMLLNSYEVMSINPSRLIGPFVLITLGVAVLVGTGSGQRHSDAAACGKPHGRRDGYLGGISLIGVGIWLLISQTGMFGLTFRTSWPLLVILWGTVIAIRGWR